VDDETRADLGLKKEKVTEFIKAAATSLAQKNVASAIRNYSAARELISRFFEGMPVTAALNGRDIELGAHVDSRLEELLAGLTLTPLKESVKYTAEGKPRGVVAVGADWKTEHGVVPAAQLPLDIGFSKGNGRLGHSAVVTDSLGKAEIPLEWVDPAATTAALEVTLDSQLTARLPAQMAKPSCTIALSRGKSVSFLIRVRLDGAAAAPEGLERGLREALRDSGFDAVKLAAVPQDEGTDLLQRAQKAHADYLLVLDLSAQTRHEADLNIYSAQAQGSADMRDLADRGEVFNAAGPAAKGFGSDASGAGWDALEKAAKELMPQVRKKIEAVR
jgi:hypothetical protein